MSEPKIITGNIFTSNCQTLVNTVNCVGVMGAGLALECRLRYPDMYEKYVRYCKAGQLTIGTLFLYTPEDGKWVLNFPTKQHWRYPSKIEYLHAGLEKFMATYEAKGITSIAFPVLGTDHGGLDHDVCLELMLSYLTECSIPVQIYEYDRSAADDLYEEFKRKFLAMSPDEVSERTGLKRQYVMAIHDALLEPSVRQMNQLARRRNIGDKTLTRAFDFALGRASTTPARQQQSLDV